MIKLSLKYYLLPVAVLFVAVGCAKCTTEPACGLRCETASERLIREKQDEADFASLQAEKAYERMSDIERISGVVYE